MRLSFNDIIDAIEAHPLVTALVVFAVVFVGAYIVRHKASVAAPLATMSAATGVPPTTETVNNTFSSYPISTVVNTQPCPPGSHFVASTSSIIPMGATPTTGGYCVVDAVHSPPPVVVPPPVHTPPPVPMPNPTSMHPTPWPTQRSTLTGIAAYYHIPYSQIQSWNHWIFDQRHTWDLIYVTDTIRVG